MSRTEISQPRARPIEQPVLLQDGTRAGERQEPLHLRGRQVRSVLLRRQLVDTARRHEVIYPHEAMRISPPESVYKKQCYSWLRLL